MQAKALQLPNTGMAVIYDTAEEADNHPKNKRPAGERMALLALARTYGRAIEYSGPAYAGMSVEGDKIRVRFDHLGGGLVARELPRDYRPVSVKPETRPLIRKSPGGSLEGFELKGADGSWHWADAGINDGTVVVSSPHVAHPVAVRYAWADFGFFNLFNKAGLPAAPFQTPVNAVQ
jgi:sialate O-acetylesterase